MSGFAVIPKSLYRHGWGVEHLVWAAVLVALGVWAKIDVWSDIFEIASHDEEASHIFLVPLVFGWLVWVRRQRLRQCVPIGRFVGPIVVGFGGLLSWWGVNHGVQTFEHGGAVLVMLGCLITATGVEVIARFFPAFLALVFLVPIPGMARQAIALPLQEVTAKVTQGVLEVVGVMASRSGNVLQINGVDIGIAEACNGLRMVFALALVSYAFAFGTPLTLFTRIVVLAASPISAILCNIVRLVPTVWLYGYFDTGIGDSVHSIGGWCMLGVAFLVLIGIIRLLRWALVPVTRYTLAYDW